ncbi:hypothetical protein DRN98_03995 [Methanosarcinales archaeon]|nr:MAG: hypothetical protein DRN98_03995 [Methanosarcinales archaeon]
MEEKNMTVEDLTKQLSDISRNTGKRTFKIGYTATEGNMSIHKCFQQYCFDKSNNEYLAGIGKLLDAASNIEILKTFDERLRVLEALAVKKLDLSVDGKEAKEEVEKKEEDEGPKTF